MNAILKRKDVKNDLDDKIFVFYQLTDSNNDIQ